MADVTIGNVVGGEDTAPDAVTTILETEAAHDTAPISKWIRLWRAVKAGLVQPTASSGAGADIRVKGQNAATGAGGSIILEPGVHVSSGADGAVIVRQPGGTPGTNEIQLFCPVSGNGTIQSLTEYTLIKAGSTGLALQTAAGSNLIVSGTAGESTLGTELWRCNTSFRSTYEFLLGGNTETGMSFVTAGVARMAPYGGASPTWLQNTAARARLTADVTNATTTFSNLTDLSITLIAGRKYTGKMILKGNNSTAAEGFKLDFNGGNATMTSFWAAASELVGGTTVLGTAISTSLAGVINYTTITGETVIEVFLSFVCNAAGTFIPRAAENSHAAGTLTVELGSFVWLEDMPN